MVTTKYYIEDVQFGTVLLNNATWEQFTEGIDAKTFASFADAEAHVNQLNDGVYRVFSRITKVTE